jgi:hypothetical protein
VRPERDFDLAIQLAMLEGTQEGLTDGNHLRKQQEQEKGQISAFVAGLC